MKLFSSVLLLVAVECLFAESASSKCRALNRTLFSSCVRTGYNVSAFNSSRQDELANSITSMQRKLNCSEFSAPVMTCSVYLPQCSTSSSARLPCKNACRNFVSGCQSDSRADREGLMSLFSGLCDLLPTHPPCLPNSRRFNDTIAKKVTCHNLTVTQCAGAGYKLTSVSSAYQKMVEASNVFQNSTINSTLRKIICMEVAPPCVSNYTGTLLVPCKRTCEAAFNESEIQFKKTFKSRDYCSAFPVNGSGEGHDHCMLQAFPSTGYWPSDLWKSIGTFTATSPSPTFQATVPSTKASRNESTTTQTSGTTGGAPAPTNPASTKESTAVQTSGTTGSAPASTKPASTNESTAMQTSGTTGGAPAPTKPASTKESTAVQTSGTTGSAPAPTKPASTNVSGPVPTTQPTVITVPKNQSSVNSSSTVQTTRASVNGSTPLPTIQASTVVSIPVSKTQSSVKSSSSVAMTRASAVNSSTLVSTSESPVKGSMSLPATNAVNGTIPTPKTRAPVTRSSPVPRTSASIKSSTPAITATSEKSTTPSRSKGSPKVHASTSGKLSAGVIVGIVMGIIAGLALVILGVILFRRYRRSKIQFRHSLMVNMDEL